MECLLALGEYASHDHGDMALGRNSGFFPIQIKKWHPSTKSEKLSVPVVLANYEDRKVFGQISAPIMGEMPNV